MKIAKLCAGMSVLALACMLLISPVQARAAGGDDEALKQMQDAKMTLVRAIEAAQTASKGTPVAAQVKMDGKTGSVIVHCLVGDKCLEVPVDIKSAKADKGTEATAAAEASAHTGKAKDIVKALTDDKMTLVKAIETAEKHAKAEGKAISVTTKYENSKLEIIVKTGGDKPATTTIDGKTGKVVKGDQNKEKEKEKKPAEKKPSDKKPSDKKKP